MSVDAPASIVEYLDTSYSPDREYVDGVIVERNWGEKTHSWVQANLIAAFRQGYPDQFVRAEQRVRTTASRSRIPDVCVTLEEPLDDVFQTPPFIAVEILSKGDDMSEVLEKLEEYWGFGVPHIWLLDPRRKKGFIYRGECLEEVTGGTIEASDPRIGLALEEVFRGV
jgi:Uma2 family endonuclease